MESGGNNETEKSELNTKDDNDCKRLDNQSSNVCDRDGLEEEGESSQEAKVSYGQVIKDLNKYQKVHLRAVQITHHTFRNTIFNVFCS